MSLINEALKRSESDKRRNASPYFDNLTVMMPDGDDEMPPPPRPDFQARRPENRPTSRLLILALVASAAFGGWLIWSRSTGQTGPSEAAAQSESQPPDEARPMTPEQMLAAANRNSPAPTLSKHNTDSLAGTIIDEKLSGAKGKAKDAFTAAMQQLARARERNKAGEIDRPDSAGSEPLTSGGKPITFRRARPSDTGDMIPPETDSKPDGAPDSTAQADTEPRPEKPDPPTAEKAPDPPAKHDKTRGLRVTAIMGGPEGNVAIINGSVYRQGQTVKGATIKKIGRYQVELEAEGRRFTIRISS